MVAPTGIDSAKQGLPRPSPARSIWPDWGDATTRAQHWSEFCENLTERMDFALTTHNKTLL